MFLKRLIEEKKKRLAATTIRSLPPLNVGRKRDFYGTFSERFPKEVKIVAEVKFASPTLGRITSLALPELLNAYERGGADAISVITEDRYFHGSKEILREARRLTDLPILRKDFIVHPYEVYESRSLGADCVLLISEALEREELVDLISLCRETGLDCLVEVHTMQCLETLLSSDLISERNRAIMGINNRNLESLRVDLSLGETLLSYVPEEIAVIIESGIERREHVERFRRFGVSGFLIGTALLKANSPVAKLRELKNQ